MRVIGCVAIAGAVLATGCGSSSPSAGSRAHSGFIRRANHLCAEANHAERALVAPQPGRPLARFARGIARIGSKLVAQLQGLTPPSPEAGRYSRFLRDMRNGTRDAESLQRAAIQRNPTSIQRALRKLASNTSQRDASALGLGECAKNVMPRGD